MKSAYLMYQDYGPGIDAGSAFRRSFETQGGSILGEARIPLTNQDFSAYIQKVRDSKAQALYGFFNYTGGLQVLKTAATAGLTKDGTKILSTDSLVSESDLDSIGDITLGLTSVSNYTYTHGSVLNRQFVRAFRKAFGSETEVPNFSDVAGFDVMNAIYMIAKEQSGKLDPDKTIALARGMQFESPRGPISIDAATRDIIENVYIVRVQRQNGHNIGVEIQTIVAVKDPNEH
jgi:branched-chain amino acid transport system substrate-binding protein